MNVLLNLGICGLVICSVAWIKNDNAYNNQMRIADAVYEYHMFVIRNHQDDFLVEYSDIEKYEETFCRFWDWGYTRLLPPDKFEIIKPFIKKENK